MDDLQFGNALLHARIKRSPHPHAFIKRLTLRKRRALPGVKAVVTGQDFPGYIGLYLKDRHIFCRDRVRYVGDPVAGVAAVSEEIAQIALDLIEVEYEVLEPVLDPEFGAGPKAPVLHPDLGQYVVVDSFSPNRERTFPITLNSARGMSMPPGRNARHYHRTVLSNPPHSACAARTPYCGCQGR